MGEFGDLPGRYTMAAKDGGHTIAGGLAVRDYDFFSLRRSPIAPRIPNPTRVRVAGSGTGG